MRGASTPHNNGEGTIHQQQMFWPYIFGFSYSFSARRNNGIEAGRDTIEDRFTIAKMRIYTHDATNHAYICVRCCVHYQVRPI